MFCPKTESKAKKNPVFWKSGHANSIADFIILKAPISTCLIMLLIYSLWRCVDIVATFYHSLIFDDVYEMLGAISGVIGGHGIK